MKDRFDSKWTVVDSGCWEWKAGKHGRGYGLFHTGLKHKKGKMDYAHRVSMHLYKGMPMTEEGEVCHSCDNTSCVNPAHLFIGSHTDNMRDMVDKGRHVSPTRKLSNDQYELAVFLREEGAMVKDIANLLHIDRGHASRVTRGLTC